MKAPDPCLHSFEGNAPIAWHCPPLPAALEQEYLQQKADGWLYLARHWVVEVAAVALAMVWGAARSSPKAAYAVLLLQGFATLAAAMSLLHLRRMPPGWPRELTFGAAALVNVAAVAAEGSWMTDAFANRYVMASGLTLLSVLLIVPLRLRSACVLAAFGWFALAACVLLSPNPAMRDCWDLVVFIVLALALCLRVRSRTERTERSLFLMRRREIWHRNELGITNQLLLEMSRTDPLTGVANRRSFDLALSQAMEPAGDRPILLLIDVDHFKRYNDTWGHPKGDECLRLVARAIAAQLRGSDLLARTGGEEFAVLLSAMSAVNATEMAERIRFAVSSLVLSHPGRPDTPPVVTISIGAAAATRDDTVTTLVSRADAALYAAKAAGRNRIDWAHDQPVHQENNLVHSAA